MIIILRPRICRDVCVMDHGDRPGRRNINELTDPNCSLDEGVIAAQIRCLAEETIERRRRIMIMMIIILFF